MPFERGPDELKDLPAYFGKGGRGLDLSRYDIRIFAEIVDASALSVDAIVERAAAMRAAGADVIDLGCLPDTPFPHLEDTVRALKADGLRVSVDSANSDELCAAAGRARNSCSVSPSTLSTSPPTPARCRCWSRRSTATRPRCCGLPRPPRSAASRRCSIR